MWIDNCGLWIVDEKGVYLYLICSKSTIPNPKPVITSTPFFHSRRTRRCQAVDKVDGLPLYLLVIARDLDLFVHGEGAPGVEAVLRQRLFETILPGLARPVLTGSRDRLVGVRPARDGGGQGRGGSRRDEHQTVRLKRRWLSARYRCRAVVCREAVDRPFRQKTQGLVQSRSRRKASVSRKTSCAISPRTMPWR